MHFTRRFRGFTLIELLVVLAVIGLLVALVPFAFDKLNTSSHYRDALRAMRNDLQQARQLAVTQNRDISFRVDLKQRTFGLDGNKQRALPPPLQVQATVAQNQLSADSVAAIRFLPGGGATGGSIDLYRAPGIGTRLHVDWLTGRVSQEALAP